MNEKEIGELRRRQRRDRSNITAIYGCYVNDNKEIITQFRQSTGIMPENESDKYFALLRRVFSGGIGKNELSMKERAANAIVPNFECAQESTQSYKKRIKRAHGVKGTQSIFKRGAFVPLLVSFKSSFGLSMDDYSFNILLNAVKRL